LSDVIGSWKIIARSRPRTLRSAGSSSAARSTPPRRIRPSSMRVCFQSVRATLIDASLLPPGFFVARAMHRAVMRSAERDSEFIAGFAAERARLHKSDVMRIRRLAAAQQARLLHYKAKVVPVAIAARRRHREHALIDTHLISAGIIRLANLLTTRAVTFGRIDIHNLSVSGRQKLGKPFFKRFLQQLCIFCAEPILGSKSSLCPVRCTLLRLQASNLTQ